MKICYCLIVDENGNEERKKSSNYKEILKFIGKRKNLRELRTMWKEIEVKK